jgi:RNA polymerase sigma factor (sigma-70 family)
MGKTSWAALRDLLADRYEDFRLRLTRRLGSEELARESLHETWVRLNRYDDIGPVQSPAAYVMRIALNIATDQRRAEGRRARRSETLAALEIADPAPGPAREAEGRIQFEALRRAIDALPDRSREILMAARLQGLSQQDIADRFGISTRMVRIELRRALDYCEAQLKEGDEEKEAANFLSEPLQSSIETSEHSPSVTRPAKKDGAR